MTAESNNTATVAMYLDLSVLIKADDTVLGNITNLSTPMKFTVVVPENLLAEGREFYILRVHNGAVNKIVPEHNKNILTFGTDRFSTYAVVYEDKKLMITELPRNQNQSQHQKRRFIMLSLSI